MLTNFDTETAPLNDTELEAARCIADCMMRYHVGEIGAVTADKIGQGMAKTYPQFLKNNKPYLTGARVRKIINYLRTNDGMLIVSNSKGYFMADTIEQVRDCIRSLKERCNAIANVAASMERNLHVQFAAHPAAQMKI